MNNSQNSTNSGSLSTASIAAASATATFPMDKKELTRLRILDASRSMFADRGFEATNVLDIAKRINMAHGTIYYHFKDKKSILKGLLSEFLGKLKDLVGNWALTTDTEPATAQKFTRDIATLLYENRELASIVLKESYYHDPDVRAMIDETYGYLRDRTEDALKLGIALGVVRPVNTEIAAVATIGMIKEVVFYLIESKSEPDLEAVVAAMTDLQFFGFRP
jgi:AcrR family transcriptional regulator